VFWERLVTHKVTHLLASPAVYEGLLTRAEANPDQWQSVRLATTSAEPISPSMVQRWRRNFPDIPLLNLYGSTECSSNVTHYDTRELSQSDQRVPIGVPLANVRVYILDEHLSPCPIGAIGEMYVAGACLARGYLNNAELTKRHFLADPFVTAPESRMYKTGDLARFRPDGNIELLGRVDRQVNVRGFRVELDDVENVVLEHPAVRQCTVVLRVAASGDPCLAAYVVGERELGPAAIRGFVRDRLPEYMVPADYVFLDSLPLTAAGKVDTRALPEPEQSRLSLETTFVAPTTATEKSLEQIWTELLGISSIGIEDDFFDLGGHSLLASRMLFRAREIAGRDIPLRTFFEVPTISGLASHIEILRYAACSASNDSDDEEREEISL
jgi:acyl-coenzyme A synthetase/AMP-(fatty) acid ligase